jgi:quinoprotein glucose dehydrogenase
VNIDGGAAHDPETGKLYVASLSGLSTATLGKDPCSEFDYSSVHDSCGLLGSPAPPPGYTPPRDGSRGGGFEGRAAGSAIGGISILKPKQMGGITAYDMNSGEKSWWIPNGGFQTMTSKDPLFQGVTLPPQPARGQAQLMNTKTLVIYGTGRIGGVPGQAPMLYAVDKATGKQVGAVKIPQKTTAVPMTFLHKGVQYIVFAMGAEEDTRLVALRLPPRK